MALVTPLLGGRRVMFPIPVQRDPGAVMRHLKDLMESGAFRPLLDHRYPLDQIADAYRYVETGQKVGNVVITVR
jgi:NADPH:quinone reductase-like Zn-dependent oxidoreductase